MFKNQKWQFFLILTVIALTIYNILPTIFYYCKPLKSPITENQAEKIGQEIADRVNQLETDAKEWIQSYCDLLKVKPLSIHSETPQSVLVSFAKTEEASLFRTHFPKAASLIPFVPAQMGIIGSDEGSKDVLVLRKIPVHLSKTFFSYAPKGSPQYRDVIIDRAAQIAVALAGPSEAAMMVSSNHPSAVDALTSKIQAISSLKGPLLNRYASSFTQADFNRKEAIKSLIAKFDQARDTLKTEIKTAPQDRKAALEKKELSYTLAETFLKKHETIFASGKAPLSFDTVKTALQTKNHLSLEGKNPLFAEISIDWDKEQISLSFQPDARDVPEQFLIDEVAKATHLSKESFKAGKEEYTLSFHDLGNTSGLFILDLEKIALHQMESIQSILTNDWHPKHIDLKNMAIVDVKEYEQLSPAEKALSILVERDGSSISVQMKGLERVFSNYEQFPNSEEAQQFRADFKSLSELLRNSGFVGYRDGNGDFIFELADFYRPLIGATREKFQVRGSQKYAVLELADLEQRLITVNQIETQIHEDLLKCRDEYNAAQVNLHGRSSLDVPEPSRSVLWSNLNLTLRKLFRGDEKKVIHWGLDLSGGKTVQIQLRDANNRPVKNDADIKQGINELYKRVNKMGVSEVSIRQVGDQIVLDFPGSQSMSASELIKASSMYFHIVNEKFSLQNHQLAEQVNRFLSEVWNEAIVSNRKDIQSINEIARKHLSSDSPSYATQMLRENGLKFAANSEMGSEIKTDFSKIAMYRGDTYKEWHGQSHPLLIVFNNFVLEGSQLDQIRSNYDPQKGNYLSFDVRSAAAQSLYAWSSAFAKEKVLGTDLESYSNGKGWRMAVVLNDTVISDPTLEAVLRNSASISGSFTQREVNQLAADLKAGSLTFTPHILSEKNVSPELGLKDRTQGIVATIAALLLVIAAMIVYYRFAGLVASVAVLFNLLILWAVLQNIGATLSLAGIAGIILTVGMAVDANVLVFERVKEEFAATDRIASALATGYKKAFSAIVDSNVTTIIAALILLNFDAGPIKGFAITLIIGIASSMFTALFMTRTYFESWAQKAKNKTLTMANWINATRINFLKQTKLSFTLAALIIAVGGFLLFAQKSSILGMDFTGGFSLNLELEAANRSYIADVENALLKSGASHHDFQIRELNPTNNLRLLFGTSMEQPGKPFHNLPLENKDGSNPRIQWVVSALQANNLSPTPHSLAHIKENWTAMSGQMSDSMRNNALIGLLISFVCIFIYITFRFETKYAAAASLCLIHDVLITLGIMGILHAFGVPVQIDLNTVAAIMTIVGYSLNDTIIVFDRIREEIHLRPNRNLVQTVNSALNTTLSRTTITSGTTLLVLIALVLLGGSSIFSFALVMTIGVFFGTLSSWYIASPLMLFFHKREEKQTSVIEVN